MVLEFCSVCGCEVDVFQYAAQLGMCAGCRYDFLRGLFKPLGESGLVEPGDDQGNPR